LKHPWKIRREGELNMTTHILTSYWTTKARRSLDHHSSQTSRHRKVRRNWREGESVTATFYTFPRLFLSASRREKSYYYYCDCLYMYTMNCLCTQVIYSWINTLAGLLDQFTTVSIVCRSHDRHTGSQLSHIVEIQGRDRR